MLLLKMSKNYDILDILGEYSRKMFLKYDFFREFVNGGEKEKFLEDLKAFKSDFIKDSYLKEDVKKIINLMKKKGKKFDKLKLEYTTEKLAKDIHMGADWFDDIIRIADYHLQRLLFKKQLNHFLNFRKLFSKKIIRFNLKESYLNIQDYNLIVCIDKEGRIAPYIMIGLLRKKYNIQYFPKTFFVNGHLLLAYWKYKRNIVKGILEKNQPILTNLLKKNNKNVLVVDTTTRTDDLLTANSVAGILSETYPNNKYHPFALYKLKGRPTPHHLIGYADLIHEENGELQEASFYLNNLEKEPKLKKLFEKIEPRILSSFKISKADVARKFRRFLALRVEYYSKYK